jgi:tripartite-type tricarboxylate transporter receptor subunit TctC
MELRLHPSSAKRAARRYLVTLAIAVSAATSIASASLADTSDTAAFYAGKQITFIVGTAPGGGYDLYARVLAQFLAASIPGHPRVVVQNMPGSAGVAAGAYVYNVAPRDGTVIAICPAEFLLAEALNPDQVRFESRKFGWLGTIATITDVLAVFKSTGVETIEHAKHTEVTVGASATIASNSLQPALANALLGTRFRIVKGYTGGSDPLTLAMERHEIDGRTNNWTSWKVLRPHWITENMLNYLLQFGPKDPQLPPGIPAISDLVTTPREKALVALLEITQRTGRSVFAPPGLPNERLSALRDAFDATMRDPGFVAQLEKLQLDLYPRKGIEIQGDLDRVMKERDGVVQDMKATLNLN